MDILSQDISTSMQGRGGQKIIFPDSVYGGCWHRQEKVMIWVWGGSLSARFYQRIQCAWNNICLLCSLIWTGSRKGQKEGLILWGRGSFALLYKHAPVFLLKSKVSEVFFFFRQTTNGSYWHCLLLQGKNQSNFGTQLSQGNHIHDSKCNFWRFTKKYHNDV